MESSSQAGQERRYRQFGEGERSCFALHMEFAPNQDPGFATPEEDASWGKFSLWVGGRNLCAYYVDGELQQSVNWYLLPLLEWLAAQWDYILHEQRLPLRNVAGNACEALHIVNTPDEFERGEQWDFDAAATVEGWANRHSLQRQREGGLFPDVWLRRVGDQIEVSWGAMVPSGSPRGFQFVSGAGAMRFSPAEIAQPMHAVLSEAAQHLAAIVPNSQRVQELNGLVARLRETSRQQERVGIMAGLGADPGAWRERWMRFLDGLAAEFRGEATVLERVFSTPSATDLYVSGACRGALMFGAVSPQIDQDDVSLLGRLLVRHAVQNRGDDRLLSSAQPLPATSAGAPVPWSEGYALARNWAEHAGLWGVRHSWVHIDRHLREMGVGIEDVALRDCNIGAIAVAAEGCRPLIAMNTSNPRNQFPSGRRFTMAHELCHFLYDRQHGTDLAAISGPWAPFDVEKRANAFAAYLLMPDRLLDKAAARVGVDLARFDFPGAVEMAKVLRVSVDALVNHLANRGWIAEGQRDRMITHLENRPTHERNGRTSRTRPSPSARSRRAR